MKPQYLHTSHNPPGMDRELTPSLSQLLQEIKSLKARVRDLEGIIFPHEEIDFHKLASLPSKERAKYAIRCLRGRG